MEAKQCPVCGEYFYAYEDEDVCPACVKIGGYKKIGDKAVESLKRMFGIQSKEENW